MIFHKNRFPLFMIMLYGVRYRGLRREGKRRARQLMVLARAGNGPQGRRTDGYQVRKVAMQIERTNGRGFGVQTNSALRPILRAAGAAALLLAAGGCSTIKDHRGYLVDPALTDSVLPGVDNRLSVQKSLGEPTLKSQFGQQSWYYISLDTAQHPFGYPRIKAGSIMDVTFDTAGTVQGVSHDGVEHVLIIHPDHHTTPTLGRERSFFEDLFGNIGTVGALPGGGQSGPGGQGGGGGGRPAGTGPNGS